MLGGAKQATSGYVRNTAIHETVLEDGNGNAVRITDFAPRFLRFERAFHPAQIFRRIEPLWGLPRITIRLRPTFNYGQPGQCQAVGSNHIRYTGGADVLRLTTDAPLSYIAHETPFALTHPMTLILGPDEPLEASIDALSREFLERTRELLAHLGARVRRSARLAGRDHPRRHHAEAVPLRGDGRDHRRAYHLDPRGAGHAAATGTIAIAGCGMPTSCIAALNRLGATQTMEAYIDYITTIAVDVERPLRPVYGIIHDQSLEERVAADLAGYRGMGPVRIGNQAAEQMQHDAYGSVILGASHMFIDERLPRHGRRGPVPPARAAWASGAALLPWSRTPARGNIAAASASTRIRRRCAGLPAIGSRASRT